MAERKSKDCERPHRKSNPNWPDDSSPVARAQSDTPPQSGWLEELGRLKGGRAKCLGVARCAPVSHLQKLPFLLSVASCSRIRNDIGAPAPTRNQPRAPRSRGPRNAAGRWQWRSSLRKPDRGATGGLAESRYTCAHGPASSVLPGLEVIYRFAPSVSLQSPVLSKSWRRSGLESNVGRGYGGVATIRSESHWNSRVRLKPS
jgi:hypothetical protein